MAPEKPARESGSGGSDKPDGLMTKKTTAAGKAAPNTPATDWKGMLQFTDTEQHMPEKTDRRGAPRGFRRDLSRV